MGPLICEAAGQAANACCYRRAKSSVCRIGTEFRSWFGAYLCGIATNHINAVPAFRCWARRLHLPLRVESRPFDPTLGYILRLGLLIRACTLRLPKGECMTGCGRSCCSIQRITAFSPSMAGPLEGASSGQPIDNTSNQRTSDL